MITDKINNLKERLLGKTKQNKGMPAQYLRVVWNDEARKKGLVGDRHKTIMVMRQGRPHKKYPYSDSKLQTLKEVKSLPVLDETAGKPYPEPDVLERVEPGVVRHR